MNLRTYLDRHNIPPATFAGDIQVSVAALYRYMAGDRMPRRDVMGRIAQETRGLVQPNDFFACAQPVDAEQVAA